MPCLMSLMQGSHIRNKQGTWLLLFTFSLFAWYSHRKHYRETEHWTWLQTFVQEILVSTSKEDFKMQISGSLCLVSTETTRTSRNQHKVIENPSKKSRHRPPSFPREWNMTKMKNMLNILILTLALEKRRKILRDKWRFFVMYAWGEDDAENCYSSPQGVQNETEESLEYGRKSRKLQVLARETESLRSQVSLPSEWWSLQMIMNHSVTPHLISFSVLWRRQRKRKNFSQLLGQQHHRME
jgi:hypothetical protein